MDRVSPFWNRLLLFLSPPAQISVMGACRRLRDIGLLRANVIRRMWQAQRKRRNLFAPAQSVEGVMQRFGQFGRAYLNHEHHTPEFYASWFKGHDDGFAGFASDWEFAISTIPTQFYSTDLFVRIVRHHPQHFSRIPFEHRVPEVCLAAVEKDPHLLSYLLTEPHKQTREICLAAVSQGGWVLKYVHPDNQTTEICEAAINHSASSLKYVKPSLQTPELCRLAVSQDATALIYVSRDISNWLELYQLALQRGLKNLLLFPLPPILPDP